ncbi:hypothetical protein C8R44DRAFT_203710 [Mycena epipterygia]|nr:hypothetical protein C8R44DRAFT_203710 [Mycena epipterygia]
MSTEEKLPHESYLVVGGGTPLGEAIVRMLLRRGETQVSILEAQPLRAEQATQFGDTIRVFLQDICSAGAIAEVIRSCHASCVIHTGMLSTAGTTNVLYPSASPAPHRASSSKIVEELKAMHRRASIDGTRNIISALLENGGGALVYVGSANAVFDGTERPLLREDAVPHPLRCWIPEIEPSVRGEEMVLSSNGIQLATAVLRPANIFGGTYTDYVTLQTLQAKPHLSVVCIDGNTALADHTFVDNAAHAALLAADRLISTSHPQHDATAGRAFFISDDAPRPYWDLRRDLWAAASHRPPPKPLSLSSGYLLLRYGIKDLLDKLRGRPRRHLVRALHFVCTTRTYDISRARDVLGYTPIVSHDEGIRRTAEWWLENQLKRCKDKTRTSTRKRPSLRIMRAGSLMF